MLVHKVFYTNRFIPKKYDALTVLCFILIRPEHKDSVGLLEHEKTHVKQFWRGWGIGYGVRYRWSKKARLAYEVEAYRTQLQHQPHAAVAFARYLATNYNLDITEAQALDLLTRRERKNEEETLVSGLAGPVPTSRDFSSDPGAVGAVDGES